LLLEDEEKWNSYKKANIKISEEEILKKIDDRNNARKNKEYRLADKIRNELSENGILIEDKDDKTTWKYK
jgi:cysteinyl-tRNA synthetase